MKTKALLATVGLAKIRVDAGFSRVGRRLSSSSDVDRLLMILAARAVSSGNALMVLCREGHANEALPLLRAIAEFSLAMRWTVDDVPGRAEAARLELDDARWESLWADQRARKRADGFGVPAWAADATMGSAPDFACGNASGLPWGHIVSEGRRSGLKADEVLAAAAVWLALTLEALDRMWPGDFTGASEIRERTEISRGQ